MTAPANPATNNSFALAVRTAKAAWHNEHIAAAAKAVASIAVVRFGIPLLYNWVASDGLTFPVICVLGAGAAVLNSMVNKAYNDYNAANHGTYTIGNITPHSAAIVEEISKLEKAKQTSTAQLDKNKTQLEELNTLLHADEATQKASAAVKKIQEQQAPKSGPSITAESVLIQQEIIRLQAEEATRKLKSQEEQAAAEQHKQRVKELTAALALNPDAQTPLVQELKEQQRARQQRAAQPPAAAGRTPSPNQMEELLRRMFGASAPRGASFAEDLMDEREIRAKAAEFMQLFADNFRTFAHNLPGLAPAIFNHLKINDPANQQAILDLLPEDIRAVLERPSTSRSNRRPVWH